MRGITSIGNTYPKVGFSAFTKKQLNDALSAKKSGEAVVITHEGSPDFLVTSIVRDVKMIGSDESFLHLRGYDLVSNHTAITDTLFELKKGESLKEFDILRNPVRVDSYDPKDESSEGNKAINQ